MKTLVETMTQTANEAEQAGEEGDIERSQQLLTKLEDLKKQQTLLRSKLSQPSNHTAMRVCDVTGVTAGRVQDYQRNLGAPGAKNIVDCSLFGGEGGGGNAEDTLLACLPRHSGGHNPPTWLNYDTTASVLCPAFKTIVSHTLRSKHWTRLFVSQLKRPVKQICYV